MQTKSSTALIPRLFTGTFWLFLYYLPFHTFITTWLGSYLGHSLAVKGFKDVAMLLLLLAVGGWYLKKKLPIRPLLTGINIGIVIYIVIHFVYLNVGDVDTTAQIYGLLVNTRFLIFFIAAQLIARLAKVSPQAITVQLLVYARRVLLLVASLGIFQLFLPADFMAKFGYGEGTVSAVFTLDSQPDTRRIASTLRGPNPLGIYLMFLLSAVLGLGGKLKATLISDKLVYILAVILGAGALFFTYSRSAWIALVASLGILIFLSVSRTKKIILVAVGAVTVAALIATIFVMRDSAFIQRTVFHRDVRNDSKIAKSDEIHLDSLQNALTKTKQSPMGCGTGCSGPATYYNPGSPVNLPENYYLQIAQEVGVTGLLIFIVIIVLVLKRLYLLRTNAVAKILIAAFVGISIAGLFLHVWTDDTIAYVWWGLAGLLIGSHSHLDSGTASAKRPHTSV